MERIRSALFATSRFACRTHSFRPLFPQETGAELRWRQEPTWAQKTTWARSSDDRAAPQSCPGEGLSSFGCHKGSVLSAEDDRASVNERRSVMVYAAIDIDKHVF